MKIYFSKIEDTESWPSEVKSYYLPYAEWLMRRKWGKHIVLAYLYIRCWKD